MNYATGLVDPILSPGIPRALRREIVGGGPSTASCERLERSQMQAVEANNQILLLSCHVIPIADEGREALIQTHLGPFQRYNCTHSVRVVVPRQERIQLLP